MRIPGSLFYLLLLLLAVSPASTLFYLNTTSSFYAYNSLAPTTSPRCLALYSTPINCYIALLKLFGNALPDYKPKKEGLDRTCTVECKNALENWVEGVGEGCKGLGDVIVENI